MALAYIDDTGIHLPDYPAVLDHVQGIMRGIYGDDLYLEADSQDGQLCAAFASMMHDTYALCGDVYNAFSPSTAQGVGLSSVVKINGIRRKAASYSTVDLRVVGQVGTIVTGGKAEDVAGQKWLLPAQVVIPAEGEITVTATAEVMGDIRAAAGEITKIATPTRGWQTVNNPAAATVGAPVEKDSELRGRQAISTAIPSQTPLEATKGAVARLSGVTRSAGYENDTNETDERGIPAHSIAVVAEGGDTTQIAEAIFAKKTPGCGTYGTTTVSVRDEYGEPSQIRFFRATDMPVYARVTLRALSGYLSSTGDTIRKNLAAYINTLGIGEKLYVSRLYTPINAVAAETFYVESIEIGTSPGVLAAENIAVAFNAVVSCTVEDIEVIAT
ncbi:baseplate J/gp47 family protein [Bilophila wadsworthia]|uniref:baseplate J/gp47 family protein n=1 Tax=Bilophila wadsworthia TaxID=35833 RepID=UPI00242C9E63|nr:hypothetical protein [Bilophila wadsworthia]